VLLVVVSAVHLSVDDISGFAGFGALPVGKYQSGDNSALGHMILDIPAAQIEAMIEPEREACPWGTTS